MKSERSRNWKIIFIFNLNKWINPLGEKSKLNFDYCLISFPPVWIEYPRQYEEKDVWSLYYNFDIPWRYHRLELFFWLSILIIFWIIHQLTIKRSEYVNKQNILRNFHFSYWFSLCFSRWSLRVSWMEISIWKLVVYMYF